MSVKEKERNSNNKIKVKQNLIVYMLCSSYSLIYYSTLHGNDFIIIDGPTCSRFKKSSNRE